LAAPSVEERLMRMYIDTLGLSMDLEGGCGGLGVESLTRGIGADEDGRVKETLCVFVGAESATLRLFYHVYISPVLHRCILYHSSPNICNQAMVTSLCCISANAKAALFNMSKLNSPEAGVVEQELLCEPTPTELVYMSGTIVLTICIYIFTPHVWVCKDLYAILNKLLTQPMYLSLRLARKSRASMLWWFLPSQSQGREVGLAPFPTCLPLCISTIKSSSYLFSPLLFVLSLLRAVFVCSRVSRLCISPYTSYHLTALWRHLQSRATTTIMM
jgi:hypothetical protein